MKRPQPKRFPRAGAALVGLAVLVVPSAAWGTPAELFGVGPRSTALAGAGASLRLDAESTLLNPAMLAPAHKELGFGLRTSRFVLELSRGGADEPFSVESAKGFFLSAVTPLSDGELESAFGLFAGSPPDFIVRARLPFGEVPDFPLLVGRASAFDLGAGLGFKYDFLSLGVGIRALAALSGTVGVEDRNGQPAEVIDNELVPAWGPVFGLGIEPTEDLSIGVALRTVLRANFDVTLATDNLSGVLLAPLHIQGVAHYEPFRVDAEVSRRFDRTLVLLALGYERWSDYPGPLGTTIECPDDAPVCGTRSPPAPNASDVFVPRLAFAHEFSLARVEAAVRAGYAFAPAALPEQVGAVNDFDTARHALSFGYSVGLVRTGVPLHLDAAFRLDLLVPRTHEKPNGEKLETSGHVQTFLIGARVDL